MIMTKKNELKEFSLFKINKARSFIGFADFTLFLCFDFISWETTVNEGLFRHKTRFPTGASIIFYFRY